MNCLVFVCHQNRYGNDLSHVIGTLPEIRRWGFCGDNVWAGPPSGDARRDQHPFAFERAEIRTAVNDRHEEQEASQDGREKQE